MFHSQDIREAQLQKTLAYTQALQYWADKSNLLMPGQPCLLARCMLELRRVMEPYVAFSNKAVLEGATPQGRSLKVQAWATIPMKTQSAPTEKPTEVAAPTEEPTEVAAPLRSPLKWQSPWRFLPKNQLPHWLPSVGQ